MEDELKKFISVDPIINISSAVRALDILVRYSQVDGAWHKAWCLDQIARALTQEKYDDFIAYARDGEDGPETYDWDIGCAP